MKKIIIACLIVFAAVAAKAQSISKVSIKYDGTLDSYSILTTPDGVTLNISPDGNIIEFGTEYRSERVNDYSRIEKYLGRTEYYTANDNESFKGKVKYIGNTQISYYASYDNEELKGKIKSIGNLQLDYYRLYDDKDLKGKIKSIGSSQISYYSSFDNEALHGKLKGVGNIPLTYYPSFEDKAYKGKVKSIGSNNYTYYSSFDRQYAGSFKTAQQSVYINGINFYLKY